MNKKIDIEKLMKNSSPEAFSASEKHDVWNRIDSSLNEVGVPSPISNFFVVSFMRQTSVVMMLMFIVVGASATVYASDSARPGDVLFPVDQAVENIRLVLVSEEKEADLRTQFAQERIHELREIIDSAELEAGNRELSDDKVQQIQLATEIAEQYLSELTEVEVGGLLSELEDEIKEVMGGTEMDTEDETGNVEKTESEYEEDDKNTVIESVDNGAFTFAQSDDDNDERLKELEVEGAKGQDEFITDQTNGYVAGVSIDNKDEDEDESRYEDENKNEDEDKDERWGEDGGGGGEGDEDEYEGGDEEGGADEDEDDKSNADSEDVPSIEDLKESEDNENQQDSEEIEEDVTEEPEDSEDTELEESTNSEEEEENEDDSEEDEEAEYENDSEEDKEGEPEDEPEENESSEEDVDE